MGAQKSIFEVCKGPEIKVKIIRPTNRKSLEPSALGISEDSLLNPAGYHYFSVTEEKYLQSKYPTLAPITIRPPKKFQTSEIIGQGSFGQVFFAVNLETGELMAMKKIPLIEFSLGDGQARIKELESEVEILSKLQHKNIVRYLGTTKDDQHLMIFMEYVAGGNISSLLHKYGKFNETLIRLYAQQILEGLEYLHYNKIIHRDIKGANVLVGNDGKCKLADFGSAKKFINIEERSQIKSLKGTTYWMAPEVMQQQAYGRSADVWSFGCLLVEMVTGKPPWFYKTNQIAVFMHVCTTQESPELPEELSELAKDFILSCFKRKPSERPNVCKLLSHPFLSTANSNVSSPNPKGEDYYSSGSKFSNLEPKHCGKISVFKGASIVDSTIDFEFRVGRYSIDNFEELNPEHAVKGPFNDIITTAKFKEEKVEEESGEFFLDRPSNQGSEKIEESDNFGVIIME